jgi:hypothetical protein
MTFILPCSDKVKDCKDYFNPWTHKDIIKSVKLLGAGTPQEAYLDRSINE